MSLYLMAFFSRNNLLRITDGANVINLDAIKGKAKHWASLIVDRNAAIYTAA